MDGLFPFFIFSQQYWIQNFTIIWKLAHLEEKCFNRRRIYCREFLFILCFSQFNANITMRILFIYRHTLRLESCVHITFKCVEYFFFRLWLSPKAKTTFQLNRRFIHVRTNNTFGGNKFVKHCRQFGAGGHFIFHLFLVYFGFRENRVVIFFLVNLVNDRFLFFHCFLKLVMFNKQLCIFSCHHFNIRFQNFILTIQHLNLILHFYEILNAQFSRIDNVFYIFL